MADLIECKSSKFGRTINDLCRQGVLKPATLVVTTTDHPAPRKLKFNCLWTATDWLSENGVYRDTRATVQYIY